MVRFPLLLAVVVAPCLVVASAGFACADGAITKDEANRDALGNDVRDLEPMKKGRETPLEQVDRLADRLLKKYPDHTYQWPRIYFHVALVYCQAAIPYSEFMAKYSKRVLDLPADPLARVRRYVDLGSTARGRSYPEARAMGAVFWLEGLREAQKDHIQEAFPEPPPGLKPDDPRYSELLKRAELWKSRERLVAEIVEHYSTRPYAATELRKLATAIVEAPVAVDALMKQIEQEGSLDDDPPPGPFARNQALWSELRELEPMKRGKETPLDEVDRFADRLLKKHTSRDDRSVIYCHLALVYIHSGTPYSQFIANYSQRALGLPANPTLSRLRRYGEFGSSLFVVEGKRLESGGYSEFAVVGDLRWSKIRPLAAVYYLDGLRDANKYHIPEARPEVPPGAMGYDIGEDWAQFESLKGTAEATAAHEQGRKRARLWDERRELSRGIIGMYSTPPYAASELRKLATAILDDPAAVDALMKQIEQSP